MKVSELEGAQLDYWVGRAAGYGSPSPLSYVTNCGLPDVMLDGEYYRPSSDWSDGGPIIEREQIMLNPPSAALTLKKPITWAASTALMSSVMFGPAPLIAAMRAFVASKYGDEVTE